MAAIDDLLSQINNQELRERIASEFDKISKQKKFGLVFEDHLPEYTVLYNVPIRIGNYVKKNNHTSEKLYRVLKIEGDKVTCSAGEDEIVVLDKNDLVAVARFGDPIYPILEKFDSIENAPDSDLWHMLIEADNYHALQLLEYAYAGKIDCIYIDPPYNTGDTQWKYNNNYVDTNDSYRHSKWLSFMKRRLEIAKKLLKPDDSVLIVTIDEKEYINLGALLNEIFPEARIEMVTIVMNSVGVARTNAFARANEYAYFVKFGKASPSKWKHNMLDTERTKKKPGTIWRSVQRSGSNALRSDAPNSFYPVWVDPETETIHSVGESLPLGEDRNKVKPPQDNLKVIWPIRQNGQEGNWQLANVTLRQRLKDGTARLGSYNKKKDTWAINYLRQAELRRIKSGELIITGRDGNGAYELEWAENYGSNAFTPVNVWNVESHDASKYGTNLLNDFLPDRKFPYPKSLYAVHDAIKLFVSDKPEAIVLDFFAGSGTTLHAVNLMNAEDNGNRQCIMVTNNEVSDKESKTLRKSGFKPGDREWEALGIAEYVTWPRTVASVEGRNTIGQPIKGKYLESDISMSDGFESNAVYFKLGFADKQAVALKRQFTELLPVLWMKAGAFGKCPMITTVPDQNYLVFEENKMAVLLDERFFNEFVNEIKHQKNIETIFIITDSLDGYREMIQSFPEKNTYQMYRDYLDNFRINVRRG